MKIGHEDPQLNAFSFKVKHSENNFVFFQKSRSISWGEKKNENKKDGADHAFSCPQMAFVGAGAILCLVFQATGQGWSANKTLTSSSFLIPYCLQFSSLYTINLPFLYKMFQHNVLTKSKNV